MIAKYKYWISFNNLKKQQRGYKDSLDIKRYKYEDLNQVLKTHVKIN